MVKSENFRIYSVHHENEGYLPYENNIVTPIQGGWADAKIHKKMQGDELSPDGRPTDNISKKAYWYSEFTVNYWVWKNTNHAITGIMHYRRALFLNVDYPLQKTGDFCIDHGLTDKRMEGIFNNYDAVVGIPERFAGETIASQHKGCHKLSDEFFAEAKNIIRQKYPQMLTTFQSHFYTPGEPAYFKCQIIAKQSIFKEYMQFVFDILFGIEAKYQKQVEAQPNKGYRLYAFMGERLMSLFIKYKMNCGAKIKTVPIAFYGIQTKMLTNYQATLTAFSHSYFKTYSEPSDTCRYLFYHEKIGQSNDRRVSFNINYVATNGRDMSAVFRQGEFWFYNRDQYGTAVKVGRELDYINEKGEMCWVKFENNQLFSKTSGGTYQAVPYFSYRTWNGEGYYKANIIIWNEPDDRYEQEKVAKQALFVFRKPGQPFFAASSWVYCVNSNANQLIKFSKSANITNQLKVRTWPKASYGLPTEQMCERVLITGKMFSQPKALRMSQNKIEIDGIKYGAAPITNWNNDEEEVVVATWYRFYADMTQKPKAVQSHQYLVP